MPSVDHKHTFHLHKSDHCFCLQSNTYLCTAVTLPTTTSLSLLTTEYVDSTITIGLCYTRMLYKSAVPLNCELLVLCSHPVYSRITKTQIHLRITIIIVSSLTTGAFTEIPNDPSSCPRRLLPVFRTRSTTPGT